MSSFLLLDAKQDGITLTWHRDGDMDVEEVQMRTAEGQDSEWATLSNSLKSSALKKKNLQPATTYLFRKRAKKEGEEWQPWTDASPPLRTLDSDARQGPAPVVRLREGGAILMEWPAAESAESYEVQMSVDGTDWTTIATSFGSTLLRKKGLEDGKRYRFRVRPELSSQTEGMTEERSWAWSPASDPASPAILSSFLRTKIPEQLVGGAAAKISRNTLAGKVVAFYFSAHWCGPCRKYTPQLSQLYRKAKAQHKAFEVVFVSLDSDEASMRKYLAAMPWAALPFDDTHREDLITSVGVNSIPRLVVIGRQGQELAGQAVGMTWEQLLAFEARG